MTFLFIAFEYPPLTTGGSQRPARLARALVAQGHRVVVVTAAVDPTGTDENDEGVDVYRIPARNPGWLSAFRESSWFSLTDRSGLRWRRAVMKRMPKIIDSHRPDLLWVTTPPYGVAALGLELAQRFKLPFIFDLRDNWSQWGIAPYPTRWHYEATRKLEGRIIAGADAVSTVTEEIRLDILRAHPDIPKEKILVVPNGYEGEHSVEPSILLRNPSSDAPLRIGYLGSFYYTPERHHLMMAPWYAKKPHHWFQFKPRLEDWRYRSPYYVFRHFARFRNEYPDLADRIQFEFVGAVPEWLKDMVDDNGLGNAVVFHGPKSHDTALEFLSNCDVLLSTSAKIYDGSDYCIAGKSYEYIQIGKPILGFVTPGAQKQFLEASGLMVHADPDQPDDAVKAFCRLAGGGIHLSPNLRFIESANISASAPKLIALAKKLCRE